MPDEMEVDTEHLHEAIKEELEHEGGSFIKQIALTTALFAAVAAIASLYAGATVNQTLVLKTESARLQAEASDQWTYYQAKGIKAAVQEASMTSWLAIGKEPPAKYREAQERYGREQGAIEKKARELEKTRDEKSDEADHLLHKHHHFAYTVALLQVAIALGAISALTRIRSVWFGSLLAGVAAIGLFIFAMLPV
jgi:hypothetical protein